MRSTHFTHQYPRRPGATRRSGYPWPVDRGAPPTCVRSPLPGWFIDSPEAGEQVLLEAVRAVLTGLR